ncbi:MAG: hypothetical protein FJ320_09785 [SAR202 cluster bacterium]|nr:hypothetical protein [SAR202 cluster bacterium]
MEQENQSPLSQALEKLPVPLQEEYLKASAALKLAFKDDELTAWAKEGVDMATQTARSWEAALEYFKVSPEVAKFLPFSAFIQWSRSGAYLAKDSPSLSIGFFRASPEIVPNLRPQHIARWAGLGRNMYKGTWKSSTLAIKFFELSPSLVKNLSFWDVEVFAGFLEALSNRSYDLAGECLVLGNETLADMGAEREAFLSLCRTLTDTNWREVKGCFEVAGNALPHIEDSQRSRFLNLAEHLAREGAKDIPAFLVKGATALGKIKSASQKHILDLCDTLAAISPEAVHALLKSLDPVLNKITLEQVDVWFERGVRLLKENPEGGLAYFRLESSTSEQVLDSLSSSVELERVEGVLKLYCCALSGADMEVSETADLVHKGIGWVSENQATTEGTKVFLPPIVDLYPAKNENFSWYKVVSTHQVAHLEFGSFYFSFDHPAVLFKDTRQKRLERLNAQPQEKKPLDVQVEADDESGQETWITDIGRFFNLMEDRRLGLDLFTILEDGRLDARVKGEYRGIVSSYKRVQGSALEGRPAILDLPLRQAMVEVLVRFSLDQYKGIPVPKDYAKAAKVLAKIQRRLLNIAAAVEDSSEATLRAYDIISRIPNRQEDSEEFENQDFDSDEEFSENELSELIKELENMPEKGDQQPQEDQEYESPEDVDFRGEFKPELVQTLNRMRGKGLPGEQAKEGLTKEMLEQLLQNNPELDMESNQDEAAFADMLAQNLMHEAGMAQATAQPGKGYGPIAHVDEQGGSLEAKEPKTFVYDEWDFRADDYKPKWCIVREKVVDEGDIQFYGDTMRNYATLLNDVRRQFELVIPEGFRKLRRQPDGEEFDLDAAIEAVIDRRSGITPSEKVYWFRNKQERDVAVVFLLDMSASTAEAIDEGRPSHNDHDAPDDPVEYMMWLRSRREGMVRRNYKRIIDLEKEGVALLMQALESIGDLYGIYGFSGYGRENVEFYVIKDIDEDFSDKVKRRIDKVSPLHATRMGPAIRHATTKLVRQEAKTKLLFLISDGRPQDRGYSREGVEKEYAVHDTHMALVEARKHDIIPFCLTVDKSGHDYLKTMCGDMSYEVLDEIWTLPQRLPQLYRKLTV